MRVISGSARGLKLLSLEGEDTRPTLDRVKEALFSMLTPFTYSAKVLDLFAGSGGLGIEALSRGADCVAFVDMNPSAMNVIKENVKKASFLNESSFHTVSFEAFLNKDNNVYDIIFLDPPYAGDFYEKALNLIYEKKLLSPEGVISVEWDNTISHFNIPDGFEIFRERKYGRVMITLLQLKQS